jgi:predicted membrane chloride channel (bestrophin family)
MDEVSKSLDLAARSIESERTALQGLGGQLQTQSQALSTQITQFRGLLSGEVAANLQGVRASNDAIAASWARVNQQTLQNLDLFAQRTKDYADHIGNTITLPQDVQNLDGTLADLRDTLRHLKGVLEAHERVADGPTA